MKKLFYMALILAIAGMGCTKTSNLAGNANGDETYSGKFSTLSVQLDDTGGLITTPPANPDNPYDIYGSEHNRVVLLTQSTWDNEDATLHDIYNAVIAVPVKVPDPIPTFDEVQQTVDEIIADTASDYHNIILNSALSEKGKQYAFRFLGFLENLQNMTSFQDFLDSCINLETIVQNDRNLSSTDQATLLKTASIERYSTVLWINQLYEKDPSTSLSGNHGVAPFNTVKKIIAFVKKHSKQIISAAGADLSAIASQKNFASVVISSAVAYITAT